MAIQQDGKYILQNLDNKIGDLPHMDIAKRQPEALAQENINVTVSLSLDDKHVSIIFPARLLPMEGMLLGKHEALKLAALIAEYAHKLKG